MKTCTIIGGVNGVGKTSFTGLLERERNDLGQIIDTDRLNAENGGDRIKGGRLALENGLSFTQETTLSGVRTLKTVRKAVDCGYCIRLYYIAVGSMEESVLRIKNRVRKGGHDISEKDVRRRFDKRFNDLAAVLPYCTEAYFYDNENGFVCVGEYKNGKITVYGGKPPEWFAQFTKYFKSV